MHGRHRRLVSGTWNVLLPGTMCIEAEAGMGASKIQFRRDDMINEE
jgi:hypothetical protein